MRQLIELLFNPLIENHRFEVLSIGLFTIGLMFGLALYVAITGENR
jgi:hypothetical protein